MWSGVVSSRPRNRTARHEHSRHPHLCARHCHRFQFRYSLLQGLWGNMGLLRAWSCDIVMVVRWALLSGKRVTLVRIPTRANVFNFFFANICSILTSDKCKTVNCLAQEEDDKVHLIRLQSTNTKMILISTKITVLARMLGILRLAPLGDVTAFEQLVSDTLRV